MQTLSRSYSPVSKDLLLIDRDEFLYVKQSDFELLKDKDAPIIGYGPSLLPVYRYMPRFVETDGEDDSSEGFDHWHPNRSNLIHVAQDGSVWNAMKRMPISMLYTLTAFKYSNNFKTKWIENHAWTSSRYSIPGERMVDFKGYVTYTPALWAWDVRIPQLDHSAIARLLGISHQPVEQDGVFAMKGLTHFHIRKYFGM